MLEREFDKFVTDRFKDHQSPVPDYMWKRIKGVEDNDRKAFFFWKWYYNIPIVLIICLLAAYFIFAYYMLHPAGKIEDKHGTGLPAKERVMIDSGRRGGQNPADPVAEGGMGGRKVDDGKMVGGGEVTGGGRAAGEKRRVGERLPAGEKRRVGEGLPAGERGMGGGLQAGKKGGEGGGVPYGKKGGVSRGVSYDEEGGTGGRRRLGVREVGEEGGNTGGGLSADEKGDARKKISAGKRKQAGAGVVGKKNMQAGLPDSVLDKSNDAAGGGVLMKPQKKATGLPPMQEKNAGLQEKNAGLQENGGALHGKKGLVLKKDSLAKKLSSKKQPEETPKAPKKGLLGNKPLYIEMYVSPDLPFTTQRASLSYSTGARLSRMLTRNFSASIGVQYSRINLKISRDSMNPFLADHFSNLDIPFLIGYERGNAHFRAILHAGLIYNVHTCPDGKYYQPGFEHYVQSTGVSLYLGLGLMGRLNERISLFTEPYFRLQLSNRRSPNLLFSQKLDVGGLNLGLRYDLRKGGK
jgi:hypothetical protein